MTPPDAVPAAGDLADAGRPLRVHRVPRFELECGAVLEDVVQSYHLDGALAPDRGNLVLVLHALSGTPDAAGDWWREVVGPNCALDTNRYAVLVPNLLGSCYGTTGPAGVYGPFPPVTTRDMARLAGLLVDSLGVHRVALVTGGSLGGMVALEWTLAHPDRAARTVVFAAPACHDAFAIGFNHVMRTAVRLGGRDGLALARMVGMLTYRTDREMGARFGRAASATGEFEVRRYLEHQGEKLVARFDAGSYLALLEAMDAHDVGRGRGGAEEALGEITGDVTAVGIPGDLLYPADAVRRWAALAGATYREIVSDCGHDAFLVETEQVNGILREALDGRAVRLAIARG